MTYNFDRIGNRTSTVNGATTNYAANNLNQYTDVDGVSYTYDDNGNMTNDGANTYQYDYENRLIQVTTPSDTINYAYDALGRRSNHQISSSDSLFVCRCSFNNAQ